MWEHYAHLADMEKLAESHLPPLTSLLSTTKGSSKTSMERELEGLPSGIIPVVASEFISVRQLHGGDDPVLTRLIDRYLKVVAMVDKHLSVGPTEDVMGKNNNCRKKDLAVALMKNSIAPVHKKIASTSWGDMKKSNENGERWRKLLKMLLFSCTKVIRDHEREVPQNKESPDFVGARTLSSSTYMSSW